MFTKAPAISPGFLLPLCASEIHVSMVANQELPGHPVKMQAWLIRPPQHSQTQGVDRQSPTHCLLTAKVRNQSPSEISRPPLRREKNKIQNTLGCGHSCLLSFTHPALLQHPQSCEVQRAMKPPGARSDYSQNLGKQISNVLELLCHKVKLQTTRPTGMP